MYDPREMQLLDEALFHYEQLIKSPDLYMLNQLSVVPITCDTHFTCFIQIKALPATNLFTYFSFVLNALASLNSTIGYIIDVKCDQLYVYIGIKNIDCLSIALSILNKGLIQTFPGSSLIVLSEKESSKLLERWFNPCCQQALASITVIPNPESSTPILSNFDKLTGRLSEYTLFFLATPTIYCEIKERLNILIDLYNTLSGFAQGSHNVSKGLNKNGSTTVSDSQTINTGSSCTQTETSGCSWNHAHYTNITPSTSLPITATRSLGINFVCNKAAGNSNNIGNSCANAKNESCSKAHSTSTLSATNKIDNHAVSFIIQNRHVAEALEVLNGLILRYTNLLQTTTYEFGAYLLSPCLETSTLGAYTYLGLAKSPTTPPTPQVVNLWSASSSSFIAILEALQCFKHPGFIPECTPSPIFPTCLITTRELASTLYLPIPSPP